ncbi:MAG: helix-turn-helix domain-containing protein [Candidatus Woesearchaeota archaeon]
MDKILDKMGFSTYKKRAYLALIKLEKAKVGEIAKKTNIPSSKIYETLNWLYAKGYISVVSPHPLIYRANDPKPIIGSEIKLQMNALKEIEEELKKIKTGLTVAERGSFQIIYGRDAFYTKVKESVNTSKKSIVAIVKSWRLDNELFELTKEFTAKGGTARFLGPITPENKPKIKYWNEIGVKTKHLIPDETRFTIWDERIIAIGLKQEGEREYFSLWIENEYLGKVLTAHFNQLWNSKKKTVK